LFKVSCRLLDDYQSS